MDDTDRGRQFLTDYATYVESVLQPTQIEVRRKLGEWREPLYWSEYAERSRLPTPSPVQRYHARIKRPESVVDKIQRNPGFFAEGLRPDSYRRMNDALGARVVVYMLAHLPLIHKELAKQDVFQISDDPPPTLYIGPIGVCPPGLDTLHCVTKASGYASVHYVLRLRDSSVPSSDRPWFELQVRTILEDVWAEIEHVLGYKPQKRTQFAVTRQFQMLSGMLQVIDQQFNFLYEELCRFQEEGTYLDTDPLNAENLPPVLSEIAVGCSQSEVDALLKILSSSGVNTVGDLRASATLHRLEIVKATYLKLEGRVPRSFEVVANIARIADASKDDEIAERVKLNIDYLKAWEQLRGRPQ